LKTQNQITSSTQQVRLKHIKPFLQPTSIPPPIQAIANPDKDRFQRAHWPDVKNLPLTPKLRSFLLRLYFNALATRKAKHLKLPCPACSAPTSTDHVLLDCPNLPPESTLLPHCPRIPSLPPTTAKFLQKWTVWLCRWITCNNILFHQITPQQAQAFGTRFCIMQSLAMKQAMQK
jgi:hypothetical protein